VEGSSPT